MHSDRQSAIDHANNSIHHDITKHIYVQYHFILKLLKDGVFSLLKIYMSQNPTDILTKVFSVEKLKSCLVSVGLQALGSEFESLEITNSREREEREMGCCCCVGYQSPSGRLLKLWSLIADLDGESPSEKCYTGRIMRPSRN